MITDSASFAPPREGATHVFLLPQRDDQVLMRGIVFPPHSSTICQRWHAQFGIVQYSTYFYFGIRQLGNIPSPTGSRRCPPPHTTPRCITHQRQEITHANRHLGDRLTPRQIGIAHRDIRKDRKLRRRSERPLIDGRRTVAYFSVGSRMDRIPTVLQLHWTKPKEEIRHTRRPMSPQLQAAELPPRPSHH